MAYDFTTSADRIDGFDRTLHHDEPEMKAKFDSGIAAMKADGLMAALIAGWFGARTGKQG